ncbi:MAG TPA: EF-hand domain-containing protein [Pseudonocardiaceae bacterium]|jgi:Ca2+-binding EF-hand superfamily protein|nr:EF-hand domain-containing protein [Pseudonocardiaceae bacterium]
MASEFQRRKIAGVFDAMDANSDGLLEESDFQALAARWTTLRGIEPGSVEYESLTGIMLGWWQALRTFDRDGDDKVSLDEVLAVVDQLPTMLDSVSATANAMFDATDENRDGAISAEEYHQLIGAWNGVETDTDAVFPLLDRNHDGHVSRSEFTQLWTQFWVGDDPAEPGSWVFGRLPQPA